jgi:acetoin utilization deacetylase AcuC-like enzyme
LTRFAEAITQAFHDAAPQLVLISAGFDCMLGDPLGGLRLEPAHLHHMTCGIREHAGRTAAGRVVAVLEGGYVPRRVGAGVVATLRALAGIDY